MYIGIYINSILWYIMIIYIGIGTMVIINPFMFIVYLLPHNLINGVISYKKIKINSRTMFIEFNIIFIR